MAAAPKHNENSTRLEDIVLEALGSVLSRPQVEKVIQGALEMSELAAIPSRPISLRVFMEGALFTSLSRQLSIPDALEVLVQMRSALDLALRAPEDEDASSDIQARRTRLENPRTVLAVTKASLVVFLLQDMLGEEVEILPVSSEAQMADRLRRCAGPLLVLVDRKHPCVGVEISRRFRDLPAGSTVIWWGSQPEEQLAVEAAVDGQSTFVHTHETLRLADLGELCRELTGTT